MAAVVAVVVIMTAVARVVQASAAPAGARNTRVISG
jgi:hypothetical protein